LNAYTDLSHRILIWPCVAEMDREGLKHQWVRQLDQIARTLNTPRPVTEELTEGAIPKSGKWVVKREYSANCEHVEIVELDGSTATAIKSLKPIKGALKDDGFKWIIQSHAPLLQQWGEWRVFMIGGKVRYIILTAKSEDGRKDGWTWNRVDHVHTLNKLT
jgi:hypothetical protein